MEQDLQFKLGELVRLSRSDEQGEVVARAEYSTCEPNYLIRYRAGDGRQVESWWGESAIVAAR